MKVLLVADEPWIRNEAIAALSDPGTVIRETSDPRRVAQLASEFQPDVVLVDLQVGSMGGMAVARALREAEFSHEIPGMRIVLLLDRSADEFIAGRSAADAWVVKPFTSQQLRAAIATTTDASLAAGRPE
jgi:DNA-binding response OmpR family regulator